MEEHRFDRRFSDGNVAALALRVKALEERMDGFDIAMRRCVSELQSNTALTEQIHSDTQDIIDAVKGMKQLALFAKYAGYVVGFAAAVVALFQLKK